LCFTRTINGNTKFEHMKRRNTTTFTIIFIAIVSSISLCFPSSSYSVSYFLLKSFNGSEKYRLNVVIPESLYEYYRDKPHRQASIQDFSNFVTPYPLQPVAERLWEIYDNPEDFANGVLMLVHQIPYNVTLPAKYPVETMVENIGDCDLFSYIAASIMKAGGLDVVLLYYEDETHMNVGVHLPTPPQHARPPVSFVTYNNVRYYIAECTGDNWTTGWRVGECPESLRQASCKVIPLEECEEWAPGQVSASYSVLQPSAISLKASSNFVIEGSVITLYGQLSPEITNKSITIYFKTGGSSWNVLAIVSTDLNGKFYYKWNAQGAGVFYFRASWSGDDGYAGADSQVVVLTVMSGFFVALIITTVALTSVGIALLAMSREHIVAGESGLPKV